jgi:hypothetical protein
MNTTNIPGFTAEDSLYGTRGRYHTDRQMFHLPTSKARVISSAFGGGGGTEPCVNRNECTPCNSQGPSIFSPGRRFCQRFICQPTFSGGCRCTVTKGYERCTPTRNTGVLRR